jgi:peptidyl-Lys metalloendopeptidase
MHEDPGWGNGDNAQVKRTIEATALRLANGVITPTCGCSTDYEDTLAWAEDHTPFSIHFCKKFFEMDDRGWDSKRSTVYHEMTHFYDSMLDGRADQPGVFGKESAKTLAITNRRGAVRSAANFEYFVTDTSSGRTRPDEPGDAAVD